MDVVIVKCDEGTETVRPLTDEEIAQRQADEQAAVAVQTATEQVVENETTLHTRLAAADDACKTYEALTTPTGAQTVAHVKLLSKIARGLIRLELRSLDATD